MREIDEIIIAIVIVFLVVLIVFLIVYLIILVSESIDSNVDESLCKKICLRKGYDYISKCNYGNDCKCLDKYGDLICISTQT